MKDSLILQPVTRANKTNLPSGSQPSDDKRLENFEGGNLESKERFFEEYDKNVTSDQPTQVKLSRGEPANTSSIKATIAAEFISSDNLILENTNVQTADTKEGFENKEIPQNLETILQTIKSEAPVSTANNFSATAQDADLASDKYTSINKNSDADGGDQYLQSSLGINIDRSDTNTLLEGANILNRDTRDILNRDIRDVYVINSDIPILDSELVNTANRKDITVENQTPELIQNTLETIKSEAPSIETNLLTRREASELEHTVLNQDRVEKRGIENIETLIKNDNTITNSIASVETLARGQTTASLPLNTLEYTVISTDRNGAQFRPTNSVATEALLNSTVTQTQISIPQNTELSFSENEVSASLEPVEAEQIDLDSIEIDTIDIDENDIFLKRETLQALGTAGVPTNLLGGSPLETTLPNTLNPSFSLGTAQTQVSGTTTLTMPPSAPVATPAHSNAVINTVSQAMLIAKETSQGVMVQIDPPEMGRVYIDFMFESESQVNVVVKSDTVASHDILRERAEHFTQMLKDNGFENINLSFEQQGSDSNNTNSQSDDTEFGTDKYIAAEIIEAQDQAYNSALYTSNQDNLRLDIKL